MSRSLQTELDLAWAALEKSFHVRLIGTFADDLVCAPLDAKAEPWLANNNPDFDQFPVLSGEETVGILLRQDHGSKLVSEAMQPLAEGLVVSADMPITRLIPRLAENPYRLVLREDRIDGLVTQSDLLKLPVRIVLFGLITHLEQAMADAIAARFRGDTWISLLSNGRQTSVKNKAHGLAKQKMDPPLLELTDFCDKQKLCSDLVDESKSKFNEEMGGIQTLRNQLAHAATYVDPKQDGGDVTNLIVQFENALRWMEALTRISESLRRGE